MLQRQKFGWSKAMRSLFDVRDMQSQGAFCKVDGQVYFGELPTMMMGDVATVLIGPKSPQAMSPKEREKAEQIRKMFEDGTLKIVVQPGPKLRPRRKSSGGGGGSGYDESKYVLTPRMKGKFAQIIKAMYDLGMFQYREGGRADSVEDVARCLGRALGEDFTDFFATLRGAYNVNAPLRVFDDMRNAGEEYDQRTA